jgi:hypothetical protein
MNIGKLFSLAITLALFISIVVYILKSTVVRRKAKLQKGSSISCEETKSIWNPHPISIIDSSSSNSSISSEDELMYHQEKKYDMIF